jgi:hypothetical protein
MRTKNLLAPALVLSATAIVPALHAEFVYNNSTGDLTTRLSAGGFEIADEVILGGASRIISQFDFQYYGLNFSGNETVRVRFYNNDGGSYTNSLGDVLPEYQKPFSSFYDSGLRTISGTLRSTLIYQDSLGNGALPDGLVLPNQFTISVTFGGIEGGETAGVDLYNPPTVGLSENDYWLNDPANGGWQPRTNGAAVLNFGMRVQAVPEPSIWALSIAGGLCGLFLFRRRKS